MHNNIDMLTDEIIARLPLQKFSISRIQKLWTDNDIEAFESELGYLLTRHSMNELAESYVVLTEHYIEEADYFKKNGRYRYSSFEEVNKLIYADEKMMKQYMLGLELANYFWISLLNVQRHFSDVLSSAGGYRYLEIGIGHGKYFCEALAKQRFDFYTGLDVSSQAVAMTKEYIEYFKIPYNNYGLICADATKFVPEEKYDLIVIQEVLEHIEDPVGMLKSIGKMLTENGRAYALLPINAPSLAHIYLFRDIEHVNNIIAEAGLDISGEYYITANNMQIERAVETKAPINACLMLRK